MTSAGFCATHLLPSFGKLWISNFETRYAILLVDPLSTSRSFLSIYCQILSNMQTFLTYPWVHYTFVRYGTVPESSVLMNAADLLGSTLISPFRVVCDICLEYICVIVSITNEAIQSNAMMFFQREKCWLHCQSS